MTRERFRPNYVGAEMSASIHREVSRGYTDIAPDGTKTYVPYTKQEFGSIHAAISPYRNALKRIKWTKTHKWKDQEKAKKARLVRHPTFGGLNTVSR